MDDDNVSQNQSIGEQSEEMPKQSKKKSSKKKGGKRTGKKSAPARSKHAPEPPVEMPTLPDQVEQAENESNSNAGGAESDHEEPAPSDRRASTRR